MLQHFHYRECPPALAAKAEKRSRRRAPMCRAFGKILGGHIRGRGQLCRYARYIALAVHETAGASLRGLYEGSRGLLPKNSLPFTLPQVDDLSVAFDASSFSRQIDRLWLTVE